MGIQKNFEGDGPENEPINPNAIVDPLINTNNFK
jgi:hypothetical protein